MVAKAKPIRRNRSRNEDGEPNPTDIHVGRRMRLRRMLLGMSQEKLATAVGLTFQQVQKYERGVNRVGASRLYDLGKALSVPVAYFFEDMGSSGEEPWKVTGLAEDQADYNGGSVVKREGLDLLRTYNSITDPDVRRQVIQLVKSIAKSVHAELPTKRAKRA